MFRNETDQTVPYQVGDEVVMVEPGGEVADPVVIPPYQPPAPVQESVIAPPESTPAPETVMKTSSRKEAK